jgi:hypothetical protein
VVDAGVATLDLSLERSHEAVVENGTDVLGCAVRAEVLRDDRVEPVGIDEVLVLHRR